MPALTLAAATFALSLDAAAQRGSTPSGAAPVAGLSDRAAELAPAAVEYPGERERLLLSYDSLPGELGERSSTPRLRLYADGRLLLHTPRFLKGAGDDEVKLSAEELDRLLVFVAERLNRFDEARAHRALRELLARQREEGRELRYSSDRTLTRIELRLDGYRPAGPMAPTLRPFERRADWLDLAEEARLYPEVPGLEELAEVEEKLRALVEDARLVRVE